MPDEKHEPYRIEPEEEGNPGPEPRPDGPKDDSKRRGKIEEPGLLSEFSEDADFDRDPEMDRVVAGPARQESPAVYESSEPTGEPFVRPSMPDARVLGIIGAVLLVSAMIATGVTAQDRPVLRVLLTMYNTLLHTGTGVVAVFIAAILAERRLGAFEVAAARMLVAVAAFAFIFNLNINLIGETWAGWKGEEALIGAVVYAILVAALFRLWNWQQLLTVTGAHFFLWLVVYVGMQLARAAQAPPT